MANAQVLVLVRSSAPVPVDSIRSIVEAAARGNNFRPGQWTFDSQAVHVAPVAEGGGTVVGGTWAGDPVGETVPPQGATIFFNTFRQNLLDGPEPSTPTRDGSWPMNTTPVGQALRALPTVSSTRLAFRSPTNSISWDRGVPAPISLPASGSSSSTPMLVGIAVVAGLAYYAARGSERRRAVMAGIKARAKSKKRSHR